MGCSASCSSAAIDPASGTSQADGNNTTYDPRRLFTNLVHTQTAVLLSKSPVGAAVMPAGDRLVICSEESSLIEESVTMKIDGRFSTVIEQSGEYTNSTVQTWGTVSRLHDVVIPVNMPLVASTGPVLVRCWQHRPSTGPVLAHNGMFMGMLLATVRLKWLLELFCWCVT